MKGPRWLCWQFAMVSFLPSNHLDYYPDWVVVHTAEVMEQLIQEQLLFSDHHSKNLKGLQLQYYSDVHDTFLISC